MKRKPTNREIAGFCPSANKHIEGPYGYVAWHAWAQGMNTSHRQKKCADCGLYVIWLPRLRGEPVQ